MASVYLDLPVETVSISGTVQAVSGANPSGSVVNGTLSGTTASSEAAPSNAVGFIIMGTGTNTDNIRYRIGGTASTSAGITLEPGRDSGVVPIAATISICATASGTNGYELLWIIGA